VVAPPTRFLSIFLAFVGWVCSGVALLAGLVWGLSLRCDESCDGRGWRRSADAWQWNGVALLGVLSFTAAAALLFFVWRQRPVLALVAYIVALAALFGLASSLSPDWTQHLDRRSGGELLLLLVGTSGPLIAVLLSSARR